MIPVSEEEVLKSTSKAMFQIGKRLSQFADRVEAGQKLASVLEELKLDHPVILALPRGGLPLAAEVARTLNAPLDLVLVKKIGVPLQPEVAAAAVVDGTNPEVVINENVARMAGLNHETIQSLAEVQLGEIERRRKLYLAGRPHPSVKDKTVIIVDDGVATGATASAAIRAIKRKKPARLIIAIAVAPKDTIARLESEGAEVVCLFTPDTFHSVGAYYRSFPQVSDKEVIALLDDTRDLGNDRLGLNNS